jgi:hypothetical protein
MRPCSTSFISELLFDHLSLEHIRSNLKNTCGGGKETLAYASKHHQTQTSGRVPRESHFVTVGVSLAVFPQKNVQLVLTLKFAFVLALVELPYALVSLHHILFLSPTCECFVIFLVKHMNALF